MREKRLEQQLHNPHYLKGGTSSKTKASDDFHENDTLPLDSNRRKTREKKKIQ
jgi:hypothetical protein